jgi:hypothetical protein
VLRPVNKCSIADAAFDLGGGFGPAEGFGIFVPVGQKAGDGLLQARDAVEAAAWRMACAVMRPNQRSTRLSHEALVGVKCRWKRGCAASLLCTQLDGAENARTH